ncbi:DUF4275 family protein [Clostridiales bacterium COT073_COT-073]|nr:DUF4275 family protein [Clostridiales bacterium COT073_COT-073]
MSEVQAMDFEQEWLNHFAKEISPNRLKKYVTKRGGFIWHIFSYNLVDKKDYLSGDKARQAFDMENKKGARYYDPSSEEEWVKDLSREMDAGFIDGMYECYVVSKDMTWTYIKTHENNWCGPYFYKIK